MENIIFIHVSCQLSHKIMTNLSRYFLLSVDNYSGADLKVNYLS